MSRSAPNDKSVSRIIRRTHMYLALFLTPWVLMYALSSLVFNHMGAINQWYGGNLNRFEQVAEVEYRDALAADMKPVDAAKQILLDLNLDGAHFVPANATGNRLVITRTGTFVVTRITYLKDEGKLVVEKSSPNLPSMLLRAHMRHGFEQAYPSVTFSSLAVELTVLSMLFWIASGLWLWWEIKPARRWGAAFAAAGLVLFAVLLFTI